MQWLVLTCIRFIRRLVFGRPQGAAPQFDNFKAEWTEIRELAQSRIHAFDDSALRERLYKMIDYAIGRFDWYEDQRHRLLQFGMALLAGSIALVVPALKFMDAKHYIAASLAGIAVLIAFCTSILTFLAYETNLARNYPHRYVADIRSWFFRYSLGAQTLPRLSATEDEIRMKVAGVVQDFRRFVSRWTEYANSRSKFIGEDLEQVYILLLFQNYAAISRTRMIRILDIGTFFAALFFILSGVAYVLGG